jgi:hypothetical protein
MAQQKGSTTKIVLGWESTYAQAPSAGFTMPINTFTPNFSQNVNTPATLTGTRNPVEPFRGNWESTFSMVIPADVAAMWYWMRAFFGAPTTTGTGPYEHVFKVNDVQPSFVLEAQAPDLAVPQYFQYLGCKAGTLGFTVGGDGELTFNIGGSGSYLNIASSPFDAAPTAITLSRVHNFQAAIEEGGSAMTNGTEVSVNLDMGLDPVRVIGGQGKVGSINEGIAGVSGNLTTLFEDVSLYNKALNSTETSLKLTVSNGASAILEFEMQELQYGVASPPIEGPQGLLVNLNYSAYLADGSEASAIVARLTNSDEHP